MDSLKLSALLCSRLCHDLVNPVGAINNGLEIMAMETNPEMMKDVQKLLEDSAGQTSSRLQFFRIAFGASGRVDEMISLSEVKVLAEPLFNKDKVSFEWAEKERELQRNMARALLNILLLAGEAVVRKGSVRLECSESTSGAKMSVAATGEKILIQPDIVAVLNGTASDDMLTARSAPAWLAHELITSNGGQIKADYKVNERFHVDLEAPLS